MKYGYSLKEIIKFTIPMILNVITVNLMFMVDRVILTKYSLISMNAVSLGGSFSAVALFCGIGITQMANVFVGQYNGMKEYKKIGHPVWQMIYFSFALALLFLPVGLYCHCFGIFPEVYHDEGIAYLRPLLICGWLPALSSALASFFIGRGKSLAVIVVFLCGNLLNFVLDIAFVFGISTWIPAMGAAGAAYSTIIGEIFFIVCFGAGFLREKNRVRFGTGNYRFMPRLMIDCIRIGFPVSAGKALSQVGWFVIMFCFSFTSQKLATCESFAIFIWMVFIVVADGTSRALTTLSSNLIGRNQQLQIENLLKLFLKFNIILFAIFAIPLVFYQEPVLQLTVGVNHELSQLRGEMSFLMFAMWLVLVFDGIFYMICAILNSGGDTKFPMMLEFSTLWLGAVIPTCVLCYTGNLTTIRIIYILLPITQIINVIVVYRRYQTKRWFNKLV